MLRAISMVRIISSYRIEASGIRTMVSLPGNMVLMFLRISFSPLSARANPPFSEMLSSRTASCAPESPPPAAVTFSSFLLHTHFLLSEQWELFVTGRYFCNKAYFSVKYFRVIFNPLQWIENLSYYSVFLRSEYFT